MTELTLNEYRSRLQVLAEKANAEGRHKLSEFTLRLLNQENPDLKVLDAIFKYYDSISDSDSVVYNFFLDHKANVEWFYFAGFLSDQRGNVSDYFDILKECFEKKIKVDKLYQFEKQSDNIEKFAELVKKEISNTFDENFDREIPQTEYIQHLIEENNMLNNRLDKALNDLDSVRTEQKSMLEKSVSDKQVLINCKSENEQLRKEIRKLNLSVEIAKKKYASQSSMIEQLSGINDILTAENETIQKQTEELSLKYQRLLQESTMNTDIITDLNIKISELQSQLKESLIPQESMDQVQTDYSAIEQQPEYGYDFDVENEITESFPPESEFDPEPEELDYDPSDLIEIKNNKNEVKKYSNFFMNFIARHFEKKFANKSIAEQDNLIFIKLMEMIMSRIQ